jgi:hypothetical protein
VSIHIVRTVRLDGRELAISAGTLEVTQSPSQGFVLDFESRVPRMISSGVVEVETADGGTYVGHGFDPSPSEHRHRLVNDSGKHGWRSVPAGPVGAEISG